MESAETVQINESKNTCIHPAGLDFGDTRPNMKHTRAHGQSCQPGFTHANLGPLSPLEDLFDVLLDALDGKVVTQHALLVKGPLKARTYHQQQLPHTKKKLSTTITKRSSGGSIGISMFE